MVLEVGFRDRNKFPLDERVILSGDFYLRFHGDQKFGCSYTEAKFGYLFSAYPVFGNHEKGYFKPAHISSIHDVSLEKIQNEVSGLIYEVASDEIKLLIFSTKLSRSRLFFVVNDNTIYFSLDLRELLPYSKKKLNIEIAYGIMKFGETPEYDTIVSDIFSCPVSSYTLFDTQNLIYLLKNHQRISILKFQRYNRIDYNLSGGNVTTTKEILSSILSFLSTENPYLLVSGGLDSSLLNFLYNEVKSEAYPVLFFDFDEAQTEREFVKKINSRY